MSPEQEGLRTFLLRKTRSAIHILKNSGDPFYDFSKLTMVILLKEGFIDAFLKGDVDCESFEEEQIMTMLTENLNIAILEGIQYLAEQIFHLAGLPIPSE